MVKLGISSGAFPGCCASGAASVRREELGAHLRDREGRVEGGSARDQKNASFTGMSRRFFGESHWSEPVKWQDERSNPDLQANAQSGVPEDAHRRIPETRGPAGLIRGVTGASFDRFCLTAGVAALVDMMEQDAARAEPPLSVSKAAICSFRI
jgi:hypothetical protein